MLIIEKSVNVFGFDIANVGGGIQHVKRLIMMRVGNNMKFPLLPLKRASNIHFLLQKFQKALFTPHRTINILTVHLPIPTGTQGPYFKKPIRRLFILGGIFTLLKTLSLPMCRPESNYTGHYIFSHHRQRGNKYFSSSQNRAIIFFQIMKAVCCAIRGIWHFRRKWRVD